MVDVAFLKQAGIFRGLDAHILAQILSCCREKAIGRGEKIFNEGEPAAALWVVMSGEVELRFDLPGRPSSEENAISYISRGKCFGWSSMVKAYVYRLSAYGASDTCSVVRIGRDCMLDLFDKNPRAGYQVMTTLAGVVAKRFDRQQQEVAESRGYNGTL